LGIGHRYIGIGVAENFLDWTLDESLGAAGKPDMTILTSRYPWIYLNI